MTLCPLFLCISIYIYIYKEISWHIVIYKRKLVGTRDYAHEHGQSMSMERWLVKADFPQENHFLI